MLQQLTPEIVNQVRSELKKVVVLLEEKVTDRRMDFFFNPLATREERMKVERALITKFGNYPYALWSDHTEYRFTFGCN